MNTIYSDLGEARRTATLADEATHYLGDMSYKEIASQVNDENFQSY